MPNSSLGTITWTGDLFKNAKALKGKLDGAIKAYMTFQAPHVQDYMRTQARWHDQTGNARNGLFAKYSNTGDRHAIVAYHTVPYGIWLEVRWAGKYAIIHPTITNEGQRIFEGLRGLLGKMAAI